jgi:hypothetical protein
MPICRTPLPDYRFALTELFDAGRLDARIGQIYEGRNHVQALDLVERELPEKGGRLARRYADLLESALLAVASRLPGSMPAARGRVPSTKPSSPPRATTCGARCPRPSPSLRRSRPVPRAA